VVFTTVPLQVLHRGHCLTKAEFLQCPFNVLICIFVVLLSLIDERWMWCLHEDWSIAQPHNIAGRTVLSSLSWLFGL